ncbi:YdcF family protein [Flaviaesturariibacter amylovorans]|uniref:YdcF family protein n=1 Tax=Flaviaesturariibacter amylovorans TaxID=1084520 RepID=A0ABP8GDM9_9BACT
MFLLMKILLWLFRPLIWVLLLFLLAWIFRRHERRRKGFLRAAVLTLLVFSNPWLINTIYRAWEPDPVPVERTGRYPVGIVLGGFVNYNAADNAGYFNDASDRFIQAALLYKTGHIGKVIVPAGNGYLVAHGFQEATFAKQRLVELGVPAADILTDTESRNTLENARNTKRILDSTHLPGPYLLITSAAHLPRAEPVFEKQGIPVDPFPCDYVSRSTGNNLIEDYLLPQSTALQNWDPLIKEWLGIVTYKLTGKG